MSGSLGTVGTALSRSAPPSPPPANDPPPDSSTSFDATGVRDVVAQNKGEVDAERRRLSDIDRRSDAMRPPQMVPTPPPPQAQATPVSERWGSIAMMLAGFGGLLTRQPLTTSLNAMAAVNHAYNDGDIAAAKTAFDQWKVSNENAIKMSEFQNKLYDDDIKKLGTDRAGALARIRATAAALKDDVVLQLFDSGQSDRALALLGGRAAATGQLSDRTEKIADQHASIDYWDKTHPQANPQERGVAHAAIRAGKDPDDDSKQFTKTPMPIEITGDDGKKTTVYADRRSDGQFVLATDRSQVIDLQNGQYRLIKGEAGKPPSSIPAMDAAEIKRLTDGGMPYEAAKTQVLNKPQSTSGAAMAEDKTLAGIAFNRQAGHEYNEATASDDDKVLYYGLLNKAASDRKTASAAVKPQSAAAAENERQVTLARAEVAAQPGRNGRPFDPNNPDDKVAEAKAVEKWRVDHVAETAAARLKATLDTHDTHDELDRDTVVAEAQNLRITGKMSALGLGSSIARKQILDERAHELRDEHTSIAADIARQSDIHALQQSLNNLARSTGNISNFESTAMKEADLTLDKAKAGTAHGTPAANAWIQAGRRAVGGSPDVVAFDAALTSFKNEYARIMSSPTATGGTTTDAARAEADTLINDAMTQSQIEATIDTMKTGMRNRVSSIREEYAATKKRIGDLGGEIGGGGVSETAPVPGARKAPDGKWYLEDPNKPGKYLEVR
jgi:hypothetical protein